MPPPPRPPAPNTAAETVALSSSSAAFDTTGIAASSSTERWPLPRLLGAAGLLAFPNCWQACTSAASALACVRRLPPPLTMHRDRLL
ncbi:hypothetical protein E2562_031305 [Oryza meyeriana var. granulata]|uniref:Uncharacterized protein n=1 Tax=Oryza meyeriana var. granulata TaxID=110450 RepID=A0A6G1CAF3_9ORYZ|nr:hypothetical protein E2562_031305 [Oryza meyeriana var. granulata]